MKICGKNFEIDFTLENDKNNYKILSNMTVEISKLEPKLGKDKKQMESYLRKKTEYEWKGEFIS